MEVNTEKNNFPDLVISPKKVTPKPFFLWFRGVDFTSVW